jgi:cytochrome c551
VKKKLLALLFGSALVLAACGGGDDATEDTGTDTTGGETTTADAGDAEKLYNQKCSSCHGGDLTGGVGPALDTAGANLSKEDIEGIIANGQGAMPAGLLSGDEASQVAEWLAAKK